MSSATRRDDLQLEVLQNQAEKTLTIMSVDPDLQHHLALDADELIGKDLRMILPRNIQDMIENYLEFGDEIQDLSAVLSKISKFALLHKKGREIRFSLKILRGMSDNENPRFQLHISRLKVIESLRAQLGMTEAPEQDVLEPIIGLPNRTSFLKYLKIVNEAVAQNKVSACLALLRIDQYNEITHKHGQESSKILFKHMGQVVTTNLREDDVMGYVEPNRVAVLLLETKKENAKIPLNRIRWMFEAHPVELPKEKVSVTLTASYFELTGKGLPTAQIEQCQRMIREAELNAGNTIIEPVA
jgi:diguanylate cyclase (GGDEF)-like protein